MAWASDGGCYFFDDSGLSYIEVETGMVIHLTMPDGFEHTISPDESILAYIDADESLRLVFQNIETQEKQEVQLPVPTSSGTPEAGHLIWSPDGKALVLSVASNDSCSMGELSFSLIRVDVEASAVLPLLSNEKRLVVAEKWHPSGFILVRDWNQNTWWIDDRRGEAASSPE